MRRREFEMTDAEALEFLEGQTLVHMAAVTAEGKPLFRTLHPILEGGWLWFHSAPAGEKVSILGQPAVFSCEESVATVPSYFFDADRACPATTYYRSVQVEGVITELKDGPQKARVLQAMMSHFQPEGGHVPIEADHALYRAAVKGILIAGVPLTSLAGKAKLAQNRNPAQKKSLLENLWKRGAPGDVKAIELIRSANLDTDVPSFLEIENGFRLFCQMPVRFVDQAVALLKDTYWNDQFTHQQLRAAHLNATAWVGVVDTEGHVIATARALSDGGKYAWVWDVVVAEPYRRHGLGQRMMTLLMQHPSIRHVQRVCLGTRDAQSLYRRVGFVEKASLPRRPYVATEMVRELPCGHGTDTARY